MCGERSSYLCSVLQQEDLLCFMPSRVRRLNRDTTETGTPLHSGARAFRDSQRATNGRKSLYPASSSSNPKALVF